MLSLFCLLITPGEKKTNSHDTTLSFSVFDLFVVSSCCAKWKMTSCTREMLVLFDTSLNLSLDFLSPALICSITKVEWINASESTTDEVYAYVIFLDKYRLKLTETQQLLKLDHIIPLSSLFRWPTLSSGVMGCISLPRRPCCRLVHCEVNMGEIPELPETEVLA